MSLTKRRQLDLSKKTAFFDQYEGQFEKFSGVQFELMYQFMCIIARYSQQILDMEVKVGHNRTRYRFIDADNNVFFVYIFAGAFSTLIIKETYTDRNCKIYNMKTAEQFEDFVKTILLLDPVSKRVVGSAQRYAQNGDFGFVCENEEHVPVRMH